MPLRTLQESDLPQVLSWRNAPEIRRNMFQQHEISIAEHRAWFERIRADETACWLVYEDAHGAPSGLVNFTRMDIAAGTAHWGFYAAPGSMPGTGTQLSLEALDRAFAVLRLRQVLAEVLETNERSLVFHRKLGFREAGRRAENHDVDGMLIPVLRFELEEREWRTARARLQSAVSGPVSATRPQMKPTEPAAEQD